MMYYDVTRTKNTLKHRCEPMFVFDINDKKIVISKLKKKSINHFIIYYQSYYNGAVNDWDDVKIICEVDFLNRIYPHIYASELLTDELKEKILSILGVK